MNTQRFTQPSRLPLLLALVLALCPLAARAQDVPHIAVANPGKILAEMKETKDLSERERAEGQRLDEEQRGRAAEINRLREERDKTTKKNTPMYDEKNQDILKKTADYRVWTEMTKAQLTRRHNQEMKTLFDKIVTAVQEVAAEKKLDLVLTDTSAEFPDDVGDLTQEQVHQLLRQKNVLFTKPGVDITNEVIARLDAQYQSQAPKK